MSFDRVDLDDLSKFKNFMGFLHENARPNLSRIGFTLLMLFSEQVHDEGIAGLDKSSTTAGRIFRTSNLQR